MSSELDTQDVAAAVKKGSENISKTSSVKPGRPKRGDDDTGDRLSDYLGGAQRVAVGLEDAAAAIVFWMGGEDPQGEAEASKWNGVSL
jgi:hypothetical protein